MATACIYKIVNIKNNKIYIGSTIDYYHRVAFHKSHLKYNKHHSSHLQNAYNKYGKDSFIFEILEECKEEEKYLVEQKYIDELKPEYNIQPKAGGASQSTYKHDVERCFKVGSSKRKLSDKEVIEILRLRSEGYLMTEIGEMFKVDASCISRIINNKLYKHIKRYDYM